MAKKQNQIAAFIPNCPLCDAGTLTRETRSTLINYKGKTTSVKQPGDWCSNCADAILGPADLKVTNLAIAEFQASVDDFLKPKQVRAIRKKLKISQLAASRIAGGGHNAFGRYERGEARPVKAVDLLLRLMDEDPSLLKKPYIKRALR